MKIRSSALPHSEEITAAVINHLYLKKIHDLVHTKNLHLVLIYGSAQHTKEKKYFPAQTNYSTHLLKGFRICIIRTDINTKGFQMKWALKFTSSFSQIPTTKALFKHCKHLSFQPPQQRNYLRHLTLLCDVLRANKSKGLESIISVTWILTKLIIQVNHYEFRTLDWFSIRPNTCIIDLLSKP